MEDKLSCKGVIKCQNDLTKQHISMCCIPTGQKRCTNRGFRIVDHIFTYTQEKRGLEAFYIKRKVLDDLVTTEPLHL